MGLARHMAMVHMLMDVPIKHVLQVYHRVITQEDTYQWLLSRSCAVHMRRMAYLSRMRCVATRQLGRGPASPINPTRHLHAGDPSESSSSLSSVGISLCLRPSVVLCHRNGQILDRVSGSPVIFLAFIRTFKSSPTGCLVNTEAS